MAGSVTWRCPTRAAPVVAKNPRSSPPETDPMTDPRNIAHDKKVQQEKKHHHEEIAPGADKTPQPGKKTHMATHASDTPKVADEAAPEPSEKKPLE